MSPQPSRLPAVDLLKAVAAQFVVLHHLAVYGSIAAAASYAAPAAAEWLFDYGRWAVQVFLVVGGYLAARALSPEGRPYARDHFTAAANRYLRLAVPFAAALMLAVACAGLARWLADDDYLPGAPRPAQMVAHLLLAPGLLGHEALTAGAWYVAIDLQLFLGLLLLSALAARLPRAWRALPLLAGVLAVASLFWFNRDARYDNWAPYFFGAYGLGALTWWALRARRPLAALAPVAGLALAALAFDYRGRVVVALASALLLALGELRPAGLGRLVPYIASRLAAISYSLFLVHFPLLMLANVAFDRLNPAHEFAGVVALLAAWAASLVAALLFHRAVEAPAARLRLSAAGFAKGLRRLAALPLLALRRLLPAPAGRI